MPLQSALLCTAWTKNMVGIIPKPIKKEPKLYKILQYAGFGLVAAVLIVYAVLFYLESRDSKVLWGLEDKIAQTGTKEEKSLETQVLLDSKRISDFANLLSEHNRTLAFFKILEETCHPKVWIRELELSIDENLAFVSGQTPNFQTLGQQVAALKAEELIQSIELSNVSVGKAGEAIFTIALTMDPAVFKYNE